MRPTQKSLTFRCTELHSNLLASVSAMVQSALANYVPFIRRPVLFTAITRVKISASFSVAEPEGDIGACPPVRVEKFPFLLFVLYFKLFSVQFFDCYLWLHTHRGSAPGPHWGELLSPRHPLFPLPP